MIINSENLSQAFRGFKAVYTEAHLNAPAQWDQVAMRIPSQSRTEDYGWLGQFPQFREWLGGDRVVKQLKAHKFEVENRKFESTVRIGRDDFEDDKFGLFKPMFQEMGHAAKQHPESLIFELIAAGFETLCFDGQNFFDTDHPVTDEAGNAKMDGGNPVVVSNMQDGSDTPWFLFDTSRAIKPIIFQERVGYDLQSVTAPNDAHVFMKDEHLYGVRARVNAGLGLWQLAFGSRLPLTPENYAAARAAMMTLKGDQGRPLGVRPDRLVVPPSLETDALQVLNTETQDGGGSNVWKGTASLIVTPYVGD